MSRNLEKLRNIGIIAHIDAGKTTLTERMLFYCGLKHRVGQVDKGTTEPDDDPEEQERGITIYSAAITFPWDDVIVNLIDTPGHVDFTAEVERSLRVLDGAVVVFSAREGVEAQSETVWHQADKYHVPRIAFVNKLDREGADFFGTVEEIRERLQAKPLPITLPVGAGPPHMPDGFRAIIDLVQMKQLTFTRESSGAEIVVEPVPEAVEEEAHLWRGHLLEELSLESDEMTELLLADQPVPAELVRRVLREVTLKAKGVPILCGTALDGIGVQPVLDAVAAYLPSPLDVPPVEGTWAPEKSTKANPPSSTTTTTRRKPDPKEPFCGLVFKIKADRHGDLHYVRVYSGQLKANSRVYNPRSDKKENVPQLWRIMCGHREQIQAVEAGDIVGIVGLKHSVTGDTLCDPRHPIALESITFPDTVISMAIEPETSAERDKLASVLDLMRRQDPTFRARESEETGQTLISGMGELHLEVIKHRLLRDYKLDVRVHKPRVSYRETIEKAVKVTGQCHRTMAGQALFAELDVRMEPFKGSSRPVTVLADCGDSLPGELLTAAMEVLDEKGEGGGLLGFPLRQVKVTVLGGKVHETGSNELAFRMAASDAFEKGLREAGIVLLEPIMRLEVSTPEEHLGDFVSDLQRRRAVITRTHNRGRNTVIEAQAPLAELFGYSNAMRGMSQGRATCTMEPSTYGPAPPEVLEGFM
ncbi:MAG TPA: elongation factor G [Thermoguttaceae bacterium]|nr:elongation factor G [Thermoguttaceae bacterium]